MADKKPIVQYSGQLSQILDSDVLVANAGIARSGVTAGDVSIYTDALTNKISIGRSGGTVEFLGDVQVDGAMLVVGGTVFEGDTQIGDDTSDKLAIVAGIMGGPLTGSNAPILPVDDAGGSRELTLGSLSKRLAEIYSEELIAATSSGSKVATLAGTGLTFATEEVDATFSVVVGQPATSGTAGQNLFVSAGDGNNNKGGSLTLSGGDGQGAGQPGGNVTIVAGNCGAGGSYGYVAIATSTTSSIKLGSGTGTFDVLCEPNVAFIGPEITGGARAFAFLAEYNHVIGVLPTQTDDTAGGKISLHAGDGKGTGAGGEVEVKAGTGATGGDATLFGGTGASGPGGSVQVVAGSSSGGNGGDAFLTGGDSTAALGSGGSVYIRGGEGNGSNGLVYLGDQNTNQVQCGVDFLPTTLRVDQVRIGSDFWSRWAGGAFGSGGVSVFGGNSTDYVAVTNDGVRFYNGTTGTLYIEAVPTGLTGNGHSVRIRASNAVDNGNGGSVNIYGGDSVGSGRTGGTVLLRAGSGETGGNTVIAGGTGSTTAGYVIVSGGENTGGKGGNTYIRAGTGTTGDGNLYIADTSTAAVYHPDANNGVATYIGGVDQGSTFTGANLKRLHDGSNADDLHTHSGLVGSAIDVQATAGEDLTAGNPVLFYDAGGVPRVRKSEADTAGRKDCVGICSQTATSGNTTKIRTSGEIGVPFSLFDSNPATSDVGKRVYISETQGQLTLDTSGFSQGSMVLRVGWLSRVDTGNSVAYVVLGIGEGVTL